MGFSKPIEQISINFQGAFMYLKDSIRGDYEMNILMLASDFPPNIYGGIGIHVYRLSKELVKMGHSVTVMVIKCHMFIKDQPIEYTLDGIKVIDFEEDHEKCNQLKYLEELGAKLKVYRVIYNNAIISPLILKLTKDNLYDIIHLHDLYPAISYVLLQNSAVKITTIHAMTAPVDSLLDSLRRYASYNADGVIAVSNAVKDFCKKRYEKDFKYKEIEVIPNGIDVRNKNINFFRDPVITFCARLHSSKGCDNLIKAFKIFITDHPQYDYFHLNIIGEGEEFENLITLCNKLGVNENVHFLGYIPNNEVRELLGKSYIHCVPSIYEGFGLIALEAMAEATCLITSDAGGLVDFVVNNENGLTYSANNVNELAQKLYEIISNPALRNALSKKGYETALRFSWEEIANKTIKFYNKIINLERV